MIKHKLLPALAVMAAAGIAMALSTPADALDKPDTARAAGVMFNNVKYAPTWVFQCPSAQCNRAENVFPEDVLLDYCYVEGSPVGGIPYWDLVYVTTASKKYAGFVPRANLAKPNQYELCY
ncbi:hypothetical protein JOD54_004145 [Actinokineospora baliensis]|uniref:hypothetical protein n=1 Tax=Actinokineospora baliensis TaxID=547056 RepID=UPI0019578719|nr:hypothetical protein [Actinokineospora baliensis]MBM7773941.1 hypothetical protein [Actinokineospora baliensis]